MRNVIGRLAALLAGLLLVGGAHATLVQGRFDPAIFNGTARFDVSPDCFPEAGFTGFTFPGDGCGPVDFVFATVHDDAHTSTIHFDTPESNVASALRWLDGVLIGIDTFLIGPQTSIDGEFFSTPDYFLQFNAGSESTITSSLLSTASSVSGTPPTVQLFSCIGEGCTQVDGDATQFPYTVVAAPEPGSLALIGGALLAGWAARRRRRD